MMIVVLAFLWHLVWSLQPIFLNEVLVKLPTDPSGDEPIFHISHIDRVYTIRAESINERYTHTHTDLHSPFAPLITCDKSIVDSAVMMGWDLILDCFCQDRMGAENQGCLWALYWDRKEEKGKGLSGWVVCYFSVKKKNNRTGLQGLETWTCLIIVYSQINQTNKMS